MQTPSHTSASRDWLQQYLVRGALGGAGLVAAMFGIFVATGVGQDPLQYVHPSAEYISILLREPAVLRAAIGLDNAFIAAYGTVFIGLGVRLWSEVPRRALLAISLSLLALTTLLDLIENMHFLSMISVAEQGGSVGEAEIRLQVVESLVKFHAGYLGLFVLGLALHARTAAERLFRGLLLWFQLPVGVLIYIAPAIATPLVLMRLSFFFFSLLLIAWIARRSGFGSSAPA